MNHDGLRFFNPYADIRETKNCLPHWQQESAVYFVTFRLGDAVPRNLCDEWQNDREAWLLGHPKPWDASTEREYHERFSGAIERWLDRGYGSCVLRQRDCAEIVAGTLRHFDGERLVLLSSIVMPNHVHALFVQHAAGLGEAAAQLEDLHGASGQRAARTIGQLLAARLLRSTGAG